MPVDGVVFQATYRNRGGRPIVHLFGRLVDGSTFLVRDQRVLPHFWVRAEDAPAASRLGAHTVASTRRTMTGAPVCRVELAVPQDAPPLRDRLHGSGIPTFEADVRFATRYLIDRDIRGGLRIHGAPAPGEGVDQVFDDPELAPAEVRIAPRVLSFDIETRGREDRLLAIALYGCGAREVLVVDPGGRPMPAGAHGFADEAAVLAAFCKRVRELDPDILTGWNVVDFDFAVLNRIASRLRMPFEPGRVPGAVRLQPARGWFGAATVTVPGRVVLDGMELVRGAFLKVADFSLDAVARQVLGEGKALRGEVSDRIGEILANYESDLPAFVHYALTDARLVVDIVERLDLVELALARSRLTGMTPDRVAASIASFDFLYLAELGKRGVVAPSVAANDARAGGQAGGHVFEPVVGLHDNVWVFDFKSLYPSIIRTFNIDPLGFLAPGAQAADAIVTASGARFAREGAILPGILDRLFPARAAAKARGDEVASQAIKILMNSFYGVLGTPACRFHDPALANAITGEGRALLIWSRRWFESRGYRVLYGDTDSLFVASSADRDEALAMGPRLAADLTEALAARLAAEQGLESCLELQFEKLYEKLFLAEVRSGHGGARKRYAGRRAGEATIEFVGMEVVRRDWTELAKEVQRELYDRLFDGRPVAAYLKDVVTRVRSGACDALLVYAKGLRKPVGEYTASTPPHVAAARKSADPDRRVVRYVVTRNGPEPLDALTAEPDREHYVDRQIRPVAEPVLAALGLEFGAVIGDDRQLELF